MKNTGKGSKSSLKAAGQDVRRDRKSATGMNGSPKKGGRGGKFTWSGDGYSDAELGRVQKDAIDLRYPFRLRSSLPAALRLPLTLTPQCEKRKAKRKP
ncbi:hypothetical protein ACH5RR_006068 [Cinchona calisaya]|uniref:Programmed cell death protein 4 n=1 Tax=Cinchona calisaya TaxID=153742 RepID=A0ABD3AMY4_9GENT